MCNTAIGIYNPPDVRPILKAYQGKDIPIEYAKREAEDKQAHVENWTKKGKRVDVTFSSLFGSSSVSPLPFLPPLPFQKASEAKLRLTEPPQHTTSPIPPTYLEQKRKEAQALYREEMAFIETNKSEFDRMLEKEKEAMAEQMPDNLFGMLGALVGAGKKPGGQEKEGEAAVAATAVGKEKGKA